MSSDTPTTPLHRLLREARKAHGLTQAELARRVDCVQSAVSMMEKGKPDALSRETLEKIAAELGVALPDADAAAAAPAPIPSAAVKICPNPDCPSNLPYRVGDEVFRMPRPHRTPGMRCPYCGEVLTATCAGCGAPVRAGEAFCSLCGAEHVPHEPSPEEASPEWLRERQAQSRALMEWSGATP